MKGSRTLFPSSILSETCADLVSLASVGISDGTGTPALLSTSSGRYQCSTRCSHRCLSFFLAYLSKTYHRCVLEGPKDFLLLGDAVPALSEIYADLTSFVLQATLIAIPQLYMKGQKSAGFNFRVYLSWIFMAASEAMIVFFTMKGLFGESLFTKGKDLFAMGDLTFSACIIFINCKIQVLEQRNRTVIAAACLFIEIGGWFLWNIILSSMVSKVTGINLPMYKTTC